jgi:hypothetical protein
MSLKLVPDTLDFGAERAAEKTQICGFGDARGGRRNLKK